MADAVDLGPGINDHNKAVADNQTLIGRLKLLGMPDQQVAAIVQQFYFESTLEAIATAIAPEGSPEREQLQLAVELGMRTRLRAIVGKTSDVQP